MCFWYYAFWYLVLGVLIVLGLCKGSKPSILAVLLWPVIVICAVIFAIMDAVRD